MERMLRSLETFAGREDSEMNCPCSPPHAEVAFWARCDCRGIARPWIDNGVVSFWTLIKFVDLDAIQEAVLEEVNGMFDIRLMFHVMPNYRCSDSRVSNVTASRFVQQTGQMW